MKNILRKLDGWNFFFIATVNTTREKFLEFINTIYWWKNKRLAFNFNCNVYILRECYTVVVSILQVCNIVNLLSENHVQIRQFKN